ncbi:6-carboxytetrahydropterin synthase QueD [Anditalea andensis]|uniref:6-carboxy-5,6,7,8-tetrahydropterin synthase n=1 Tax=Anditalea andensis TaxID=1048983 RepID=A0A074L5Q0_9BACT|nr:6-carboxytetrahydropterin synthase QueD [Anditalea andensis]KEO75820.1 6-pyruvoyl tetrahydropterin synthase [Anditalea andensis]
MLSITKSFHFEAAHRISDYDGACQYLHGHSYKLEVTISGKEMVKGDMLMDFKILKSLVNKIAIEPWDHALILKDNEINHSEFDHLNGKTYWMETEPTAERMVLHLSEQLAGLLPQGFSVRRVKLYETDSCFAEYENIH